MSEQKNRGWSNLQPGGFKTMDKEKLRAISMKGNQAMHKVKQEKKTTKKCLEDLLSLDVSEEIIDKAELTPELAEQLKEYTDRVTINDLIQTVAVGLAVGGSIRAMEYVRDSVGDAPTKQLSVEGMEIMTDADRNLLQKITTRLSNPDLLIVADATPAAGGEDSEE